MKKKVFIGVAWPYANGSLHLGHIAGCYLPADIFARFNRLKKNDVLMVSGSDEHGTPVTITADKENKTPQKIVDRYNKEHTKNMKQLGISFDIFTRTTTKNHEKIVKDVFETLYKNDFIYEKEVESFYCSTCKRFLPDRYVEGTCPHCGYEECKGDQCDECGKILDPEELLNVKCKICGSKPEIKKSKHLFLALSKFEDEILNWLKDKKYWKKNVLKFTKNWIKEGLHDRAITRDMKWGVKVPIKGYEEKRIYVWFDAVIGYLSASQEWAKSDEWKEWWYNPDSRHYYFLAKDNIPFHSIIWPSIIMGYDKKLQLPYDIPANEYLRLEGEQFSKSRGLAIWVPDILKKLDVDSLRYYLSINMPEKRDSNWMWKDFVNKNNDELVGKYGNFVHRVVTFTYKNYGEIPKLGKLDEKDKKALEKIKEISKRASESIEICEFKKGLRIIMSLAQYGNIYFNEKEPWKLINEDKERCGTVLHISLKIIKALSIFTSIYLPFSSEKIWHMLGYKKSIHEQYWEEGLSDLKTGFKLEKPKPLFKKLELKDFMPEKKEDPFSKIDLRVAKVLDVKHHPEADKLYMMHIDLGKMGKRVIIAGMKPYYKPEEIKGKNIVVVSNLKPAKIRGIKSDGMLLAAEDRKGVVSLLDPGNSTPGSEVTIRGIDKKPEKNLDFEHFKKVEMIVKDGRKASYKNNVLQSEKGEVKTDKTVEKGAKIM